MVGCSSAKLSERPILLVSRARAAFDTALTGVSHHHKVTHMTKTQVYLRDEELDALHRVAEKTGRSVADLVREAIRRVWLRPVGKGPIGLWDGPAPRTSLEHDSIYDER